MHVVATAGHVDHGKSTLVRALTGMEPDRLSEERRRGLSIRLGYCWSDLPPVGEVAFVDVPGHERFLTTTLAGLGPVPAVLLVVAADDEWMPQAAEHLAALDALGVRHGVLAVTRSDLADAGPTLARARAEIDRTTLTAIEAVTVSGRTGAGLDELRQALARMVDRLPAPDPEAPVRLWVDRRFHVRGAGTVVTGTLQAGRIRVGDRLDSPAGPVRVRHLESLGEQRDEVVGVARVALDLGGRAPDGFGPGDALSTPEVYPLARVIDVRVTGDLPEQPMLHVGSAAVAVHARPLGDGYARLTLRTPLPLVVGDRVIVRDPGDRTLHGADVLDLDPVPLRRRGAAAVRVDELANGPAEPAGEVPAANEPAPRDPRIDDVVALLTTELADTPFAAPTLDRLTELGLSDDDLALAASDGGIVRIAPGLALLPAFADLAVERLAALPSPFRTSEARQALGTSRRVVLPLLAHLDRTGRTVRLADDTRRLRVSRRA